MELLRMIKGMIVPNRAVIKRVGEGTPQQCVRPYEAGHRNQIVTPGKTLGVVSQL
jgi:hypothetical protein